MGVISRVGETGHVTMRRRALVVFASVLTLTSCGGSSATSETGQPETSTTIESSATTTTTDSSTITTESSTTTEPSTTIESSTTTEFWEGENYELWRPGDSGLEIQDLQFLLSRLGYEVGSSGIDGFYGDDTTAAVIALQSDYGLSPTGIVDSNTDWTMTQVDQGLMSCARCNDVSDVSLPISPRPDLGVSYCEWVSWFASVEQALLEQSYYGSTGGHYGGGLGLLTQNELREYVGIAREWLVIASEKAQSIAPWLLDGEYINVGNAYRGYVPLALTLYDYLESVGYDYDTWISMPKEISDRPYGDTIAASPEYRDGLKDYIVLYDEEVCDAGGGL